MSSCRRGRSHRAGVSFTRAAPGQADRPAALPRPRQPRPARALAAGAARARDRDRLRGRASAGSRARPPSTAVAPSHSRLRPSRGAGRRRANGRHARRYTDRSPAPVARGIELPCGGRGRMFESCRAHSMDAALQHPRPSPTPARLVGLLADDVSLKVVAARSDRSGLGGEIEAASGLDADSIELARSSGRATAASWWRARLPESTSRRAPGAARRRLPELPGPAEQAAILHTSSARPVACRSYRHVRVGGATCSVCDRALRAGPRVPRGGGGALRRDPRRLRDVRLPRRQAAQSEHGNPARSRGGRPAARRVGRRAPPAKDVGR